MKERPFDHDDALSRPPEGCVVIMQKGSWSILFSHREQSLYIVPTDYHPEPLRLHKQDLHTIRKTMRNITAGEKRRAGRGNPGPSVAKGGQED